MAILEEGVLSNEHIDYKEIIIEAINDLDGIIDYQGRWLKSREVQTKYQAIVWHAFKVPPLKINTVPSFMMKHAQSNDIGCTKLFEPSQD